MADKPQSLWRSMGYVTVGLVLANIGVYATQVASGVSWMGPSPEQQIAWGGNLAMLTLTGDPWRLGASVFVHGGLLHLLMNMYMLCLIGPVAERQLGRTGTVLVYLAGGVAAGCASAWWFGSHSIGADFFGRPTARLVVSVGASGALMAICGALLPAALRRTTGGKSTAPEAGLGKALGQVVAFNVAMGFFINGVDQAAHLGGLAAGVAMGLAVMVAESAGALPLQLARFMVPVLLGGACAVVTLYASDWADLRELRAQHDKEAQAEGEARAKEAAEAARKQAAEQERQQLPAPVAEAVARGRVIEFGESGTSFALSKDGKTAYAVDHHGNEVSVIDLARGVVERRISGPRIPIKQLTHGYCYDIYCGGPAAADIAVLQEVPLVLVSSMQKDAVVFIDVATGQAIKSLPVGKSPNAIVLSPDGGRAYVHSTGDGSISVVDVAKRSNVGTLPLPEMQPPHPAGRRLPMWFSSDRARLMAGDFGGGKVHAFDVQTLAYLGSEEPQYQFQDVIKPDNASGDVMAIAADGLLVMGDSGAGLKAAWTLCDGMNPRHLSAVRKQNEFARIAVATQRNTGLNDSMIWIANTKSLVTIGQFPVTGIVMKLMLSDDGTKVIAVTNVGTLVVLDAQHRLNTDESSGLLCDARV